MRTISNDTVDSIIQTTDTVINFIMDMLLVCPDCYARKRHGSIPHTDDCRIGRLMKLIDELKQERP